MAGKGPGIGFHPPAGAPIPHGSPEHNPESDAEAIHDNVDGEIAAVAAKAAPVNADLLLIEDSADANAKKRVLLGDLPGAGVNHYQAILPLPGFLPNSPTNDRSYHFPVEFDSGTDDVTAIATITHLAARGRLSSAAAITFRVAWYDSSGVAQFTDSITVGAAANRATAALAASRTILKGWYAQLDITSSGNADALDWVVAAIGTWVS